MFQLNDDNSIYVTRGDAVYFSVTAEDNGEAHVFNAGDVLRIKVFEKKNCERVVLEKDFPVFENCTSVEIYLGKSDTKIGGVISKPTDYWYEVEFDPYGDPKTIIGYGEDGPALFKLFPEGADIEDAAESESDVPFVDTKFDLTSSRPLANRVIAAKIVQMERDFANYVTPQMYGAVGDGIADDTAAFQKLDGKVCYIPEGTYRISSVEYGEKTVLMGAGIENTVIKQISGVTDSMIVFKDAHSSALTDISLVGDAETEADDIYTGLLKIYTTYYELGKSSNYCNYEHILIRNASGSGLVLLGYKQTDASVGETSYNWVLQFNDIRIENCKKWCMVDESCDNRFSNFYLNEGDLGCLFLNNTSSNMYVNFKIDQPYGSGGSGTINSYEDGALMVCNNISIVRFLNFDLQSSYYDGAKFKMCSSVYFDGSMNNIGYATDNGERVASCLKLSETNNSEFHVTFVKTSGWTPKYNVYAESTCFNNVVMVSENEHVDCFNASSTTAIVYAKELYNLFNTRYDVSQKLENLVSNPAPSGSTGWTMANVTLDTTSKLVGTHSFKIVGSTSATNTLRSVVSGIKAGHKYMAVATVKIAAAATEGASRKAPYILVVQNNADLNAYTDVDYLANNEVGTQVIAAYVTAKDDSDITLTILNYQNNCTAYVGNVYFIDVTSTFFDDSNTQRKNLLSIFKENARTQIASIVERLDYKNVIGAIRCILNK